MLFQNAISEQLMQFIKAAMFADFTNIKAVNHLHCVVLNQNRVQSCFFTCCLAKFTMTNSSMVDRPGYKK